LNSKKRVKKWSDISEFKIKKNTTICCNICNILVPTAFYIVSNVSNVVKNVK